MVKLKGVRERVHQPLFATLAPLLLVRLRTAPSDLHHDDICVGMPATFTVLDIHNVVTMEHAPATITAVEVADGHVQRLSVRDERSGPFLMRFPGKMVDEAIVEIERRETMVPCALCSPSSGSSPFFLYGDNKQAMKNESWPPCKRCKGTRQVLDSVRYVSTNGWPRVDGDKSITDFELVVTVGERLLTTSG